MLKLKTLDKLIKQTQIKGKRVLLRADLNVPMQQGKVADNTRIIRIVPTINELVKHGAKIIVLSHFGRPGGKFVRDLSLAPIVDALSAALGGKEVLFGVDCVGPSAKAAIEKLNDGDVILMENLRFHAAEKDNDENFAKRLASLGDIYVNDAIACAHRTHASIHAITKHLPSFAGYLMQEELEHLHSFLASPDKPVAALVGGSKISSKIDLLENLVPMVDYLMIGGGMANTFLYAQGNKVGTSLCEKDLKKTAQRILEKAKKSECKILLPSDCVVASELKTSPECQVVDIKSIPEDKMVLDIGPRTAAEWSNVLYQCKTVVWNGPLGAFEYSPFDVSTITIARVIAEQTATGNLKSIAGGGDVLSSLSRAGLRKGFTYISTAGGAFLEWLEGKELPGVKVLLE